MIASAAGLGPTVITVAGLSTDYSPPPQTVHVGVFLALAAVLLVTSRWIWVTRNTRGAQLFAVAVGLAGARCGVDLLRVLFADVWTFQALLVGAGLLLELAVLLLFLRFAGRYAGVDRLTDQRAAYAMAGVGAVATLLVATNPVHSLVFSDVVRFSTPFAYVGVEWGPLGWSLLAIEGALLIAGAGLVATTFTVAERPAWWAATVLSIGLYLAVMLGGMSVLDRGPLPLFNYASVGLAGFVGTTTIALLGHGLRRLEITARESILKELEDAIVICNDARTVLDANATADELFDGVERGQRFADLIGDAHDWPAPGETTTVEVGRSELRTGGEPAGDVEADGGTATVRGHYLVQTKSVTTVTNDTLGYTVRLVDVTELERRAAELRRKNEQLDQFADIVTRDLREPQHRATEYVQRIEAATPADDDATVSTSEIAGPIAKIQVALQSMQTIIDDILTLARSGEPVEDADQVEFRTAVESAWERVDASDAALSIDRIGTIRADRERLEQLLEALFTNAVEHGGASVTVTVGLTDDGFVVADDGAGIPEDVRDDVFEQGFSTDPSKTGLGLTIASELAESHDWTLDLDAERSGARFVCRGATTGE